MNDQDLISIALVTDGTEFYAEVDGFPIEGCSEFVKKSVLPQLGRIPEIRMTQEMLRNSLHAWLKEIRGDGLGLVVSFDYQGDWKLFVDVLGGAPCWIKPEDVLGMTDEAIRTEFFKLTGLPEHHALNDAKALKFSYRSSTRG